MGVEVFPRRRVALLFLRMQTDDFSRWWLVGSCQRSVSNNDFEYVWGRLDGRRGERGRAGNEEG